MKIKLGIVGFGIVGKALKHVFETKFPIYIYDKYQKEHQGLSILARESNLVFITVPTSMLKKGDIDLSYVIDALSSLSDSAKKQKREKLLTVLKSTIIPGTTDNLQRKFLNLDLVFNPEFITEKNFLNDMRNTDRVVIGTNNKNSARVVETVYREIFPDATYIITTPKTAEMIKYASNVALASQVMIANEIYQICQRIGVDYTTVKNVLLLDKRIGRNINVPGNDKDFGFGGKCLPKDLNALISFAKGKGYEPKLFEQVWTSNLRLRKNYDWEKIKGTTSKNRFKSIKT